MSNAVVLGASKEGGTGWAIAEVLAKQGLSVVVGARCSEGIGKLRHMARRMKDGGSLVLMSTIAATNPWPGYFAYGCAKAAVQTLVKYAALEYAPRGIRVNAVIPGPIQTPTASSILSNPNLRNALFREIPLGRTATTHEVAEAVAWFATGDGWITGECLHIDGGMHLRRPPHPDELQAALQHSNATNA